MNNKMNSDEKSERREESYRESLHFLESPKVILNRIVVEIYG